MKKILALLLTVGLVITMIPGVAFAEETGQVDTAKAVARIGNTDYESLQAALDSIKVTTETKVTLRADTSESIKLEYDMSPNITLDLNGHTLSGSVENVCSKLTIMDSSNGQTGKVTGEITGKNSSGGDSSGNKGTLTIKSGIFDGTIKATDFDLVSCTGGSFKQNPKDILEKGYIVSDIQADGYYRVEADKVAKIGNTYYNSLSKALNKAKDGNTVLLLKDQINVGSINQYNIDDSIILDLNGKTVSTSGPETIFVNNYDTPKNITIKNGTIRNTNTETNPAIGIRAQQRVNLTLENVTVEATGTNGYGVFTNPLENDVQPVITVKGSQTKISGKVAGIAVNGYIKDVSLTTLIVEDGTIEGGSYGIAGNGAQHNTDITIKGGSISGGSCGLFNPQKGLVNISGGTIKGATGIEMRAGELNVSGNPVITATGEYTSNSNSSGSTSTGVGIAVAQHVTQLPVTVKIAGGTITGARALDEANPENNLEDSISRVNMEVTGGSFVGEVCAADVTKFISGGTYSNDPTGFVDDNNYAYKMNNQYIVAPEGYQAANWVFEKDAINDKLYIGTYHTPYIPPTPPAPVDPIINTGSASSESATTNADISKDPASAIEEKTEIKDGKTEVTTTIKIAPETAEKIVQRATQHSSAHIVIDATTNMPTIISAGSRTEVVLPTSILQQLANKTIDDIMIKSDVAEIKLDSTAVQAVAEQSASDDNDTLTVIAEKITDESAEMRFDLKLITAKGTIVDFDGGNAFVKVQLNENLKLKERLACVYIDDFGWFSKVEGSKNADGTYTFVTGHFSTYAIMEEKEADKLIKKQTSLTKGVRNTTIRLTSSPVSKGIKLKWKKSKGFKVDAYQVYRAAKKNGKYSRIYLTKKGTATSVINRKNLKKGTRYFYKVRGVRTIGGKIIYTKWSNKAYRIYR